MPPKSPAFWAWPKQTIMSCALTPAAWIYSAASALLARSSKPYKSALPILCIGGAVVGGSGKTPVLHALLPILESAGFSRPTILLRGYGGTLKGPTRVDPALHTAADVGDEALLHAWRAPTIISADRAAGAKLAEAMGADIILMDDGLQNHSLVKTASVLVYDTLRGVGNGQIFPAGPLRETLQNAAKKCIAVITTGGGAPADFPGKPVFETALSITSQHDKNANYGAFAGIGYPEKFKKTLEQNDFRLTAFVPFPDHHSYSANDCEMLLRPGLPLLTTEKDYVRLPEKLRDKTQAVSIALTIDDEATLAALLAKALKSTT